MNTADQPIKYDGLIGDAVLRESSTALSSYNAIPIQADPALATGALITLDDDLGGLVFDGAPGHYQAVTGVIYASDAFDKPSTNSPYSYNRVASQTTLLTLLTFGYASQPTELPDLR